MTTWTIVTLFVMCFALGVGLIPHANGQPLRPPGNVAQFVPREIVVFPRHPAQSRGLAQRMRAEGFLVLATAPVSGMILAATPMEGIEQACIQWLRAWPEVRAAEQPSRTCAASPRHFSLFRIARTICQFQTLAAPPSQDRRTPTFNSLCRARRPRPAIQMTPISVCSGP